MGRKTGGGRSRTRPADAPSQAAGGKNLCGGAKPDLREKRTTYFLTFSLRLEEFDAG